MSEKEIGELNRAIKVGVSKVLAARVLHSRPQVLEDLTQEVWVRMLEEGKLDTKAAYNFARAAARDWSRDDLTVMPASQIAPEDGEYDWDEVMPTKDPSLDEFLQEVSQQGLFGRLEMEEQKFMEEYITSTANHTAKESLRFHRLKRKVQNTRK